MDWSETAISKFKDRQILPDSLGSSTLSDVTLGLKCCRPLIYSMTIHVQYIALLSLWLTKPRHSSYKFWNSGKTFCTSFSGPEESSVLDNFSNILCIHSFEKNWCSFIDKDQTKSWCSCVDIKIHCKVWARIKSLWKSRKIFAN